ncbi:MAG: hypothetical protein NC218_06545 [Acetobacter sp.]|nr:hypothetical protein [Acetobacter sp.]
MRIFSLLALCLTLAACYPCVEYNKDGDRVLYQAQSPWAGYKPEVTGKVFKAAGFEIEQGQQMRDFFDDFEEPMHAKYVGNDVIHWVYYVDYQDGEGKIVRYCELDKYEGKKLCRLDVDFYRTYVSDVTSNCK